MDDRSHEECPQIITASDQECTEDESEELPALVSGDESGPPSLEVTDGSEDSDKELCSPSAAGLGPANTGNWQVQAHASGVKRQSSSNHHTSHHTAGINRNSRIWQVLDGVDSHQHSLGPPPADDEEQRQSFPLPSLQFFGPGGWGLVLSMPLPPSLAGVTGLSGLMSSGMMRAAATTSSSMSEPMFLPGGGLGMLAHQRPSAARPGRERSRQDQHHSSSSSNNQGSAPGQLMNMQSVLQGLLSTSRGDAIAQPSRIAESCAPAQAAVTPAATATSPLTHVVAGSSSSSSSNSTQGFLASGAAARHSADVVSAAGGGHVPSSLLTQGIPSVVVHPVRSPGSRHMLHARRTSRTRTAGSHVEQAARGMAAAGSEPFRFTATPAVPALDVDADAAASNQAAAVAATVVQQQAAGSRGSSCQAIGDAGLRQHNSTAGSSFRWWSPWYLLSCGLSLLHRLASGGFSSKSQASASARASTISVAATSTADPAGVTSVMGVQDSMHRASSGPGTAARFPASFRIDIEEAVSPGPASPAAVLAQPWQHEPRATRRQRSQQRTAARAGRLPRRNQQRQQQQTPSDDDCSADAYLDPYESCSDTGSSPRGVAAPWQGSWPPLTATSPWPQDNTNAVAPAQATAASSSSPAPAVATSSTHANRLGQPSAKRGRVDRALTDTISSNSNTMAYCSTAGTSIAAASPMGLHPFGPATHQHTAEATAGAAASTAAQCSQGPPLSNHSTHSSSDASCWVTDSADAMGIMLPSPTGADPVATGDVAAAAAAHSGTPQLCSTSQCQLVDSDVPELLDTSEPPSSEVSDGPPPLVDTSESADDDMPSLDSPESEGVPSDAPSGGMPSLDTDTASLDSSGSEVSEGQDVPDLQDPQPAGDDSSDDSHSMPSLDAGDKSSDGSDSDSDGMPQLEHESDEDQPAALLGESGSSGQQAATVTSSSSALGHAAGFRRGFLGQPLQHSAWSTQQQQQQHNVRQPPAAHAPQRQQQAPASPELGWEGAQAGFPAFLRMLQCEAFGLGDASGPDTDDEDTEEGWKTASDESDTDSQESAHTGNEEDPEEAIDRLLQSVLQGRRQSHSRRSSRIASGSAPAVAGAFSRPRSNGFMVPGSGSIAPADADAASREAPTCQASSRPPGSATSRKPASPAPVKGLPSLQRPKASKTAASVGSRELGSQALAAGLLSVAATKTMVEQVSVFLSDAGYTQQLLQGLPGVNASDAAVMSALKLLRGKQYTLALSATRSPDEGKLVAFEEHMFARNLERSKPLLRRWHTLY